MVVAVCAVPVADRRRAVEPTAVISFDGSACAASAKPTTTSATGSSPTSPDRDRPAAGHAAAAAGCLCNPPSHDRDRAHRRRCVAAGDGPGAVSGPRRHQDTVDTSTLELEPCSGEPLPFAPGQFTMLSAGGHARSRFDLRRPGRPERLVHSVRAVGFATRQSATRGGRHARRPRPVGRLPVAAARARTCHRGRRDRFAAAAPGDLGDAGQRERTDGWCCCTAAARPTS